MASKENNDSNKHLPPQEDPDKILKRVKQESETIGLSSMKRVTDDLAQHFRADDAEQNEWAELWGTRIGRTLGLIAFVILVVYLLQTYVLKV